MKKLKLNKDFIVKMPIFLDATCSGLQHLAAMLRDSQVGALVNLIQKSEEDEVSDIYEILVDPINKEINKIGKDKTMNYPLLKDVKLNRSLVKPSIMTQVYSVTVSGIYYQLTSKLEKEVIKKDGDIKGITLYLVPSKKGKFIKMPYTDVYKMAHVIKNMALNIYPSLQLIYNYFMGITKLMVKLNIPVVWFTPAGLRITQEYLLSIKQKVTLSYFGKSRSTIIRQ